MSRYSHKAVLYKIHTSHTLVLALYTQARSQVYKKALLILCDFGDHTAHSNTRRSCVASLVCNDRPLNGRSTRQEIYTGAGRASRVARPAYFLEPIALL